MNEPTDRRGAVLQLLRGALHPEGPATARAAGLRYVSDGDPGVRRRRHGKQFSYVGPDGTVVRDPAALTRIRSLAIPPAWTDVWICPDENGHVQATGRDARGRKQYRYHPRWCEVRDETKYDRMVVFAEALPRIRDRVAGDLGARGLPRQKVLAAVVGLLDRTRIRVGNEEYARRNHSYGLTTLQDEHVDVSGATIRFHFRGKSGVQHEVGIRDRRLARVIRSCQALPGQVLFQYVDEAGERRSVTSCDVNEYLRSIAEEDFTAKDFRTWSGTLLVFHSLRECEPCETETQARKHVVEAVKAASRELGNTPAVCRKCYVHPLVVETYLSPDTRDLLRDVEPGEPSPGELAGLRPDEEILLHFLREHSPARLLTPARAA